MPIWTTSIAPQGEDGAFGDFRDDAHENMWPYKRTRGKNLFELSADLAGGAMGIKMELMCIKAMMPRWF